MNEKKNPHGDILRLTDKANTVFKGSLKERGRYLVVPLRNPSQSAMNVFLLIWILVRKALCYDVKHVHLFPHSIAIVGSLSNVGRAKFKNFSSCYIQEHSTHNRRRNIKAFRGVDRIMELCLG